MKKISPADFIPIDMFVTSEPIKLDLVYAQKDHPRNIFKTALYHDQARLWAHKDVAAIILLTARKLYKDHGYTLEVQDCLRTVNAQTAMQQTDIVKANPEWLVGSNRLLAPPGAGGHPHGLAVDVRVLDDAGVEVDMGTVFDTMTEQSHRDYTGFPEDILNNRKILEHAFIQSAEKLKIPFLALASEWWDFRCPSIVTKKLEPLNDEDLPPQMQMTDRIKNNISNFDQEHFDKLASSIVNIVNENI